MELVLSQTVLDTHVRQAQATHLCCLCSTKQQSLPLLWQQLHNLPHLLLKADLKDPVSLINYQTAQVPVHKALGVLQMI